MISPTFHLKYPYVFSHFLLPVLKPSRASGRYLSVDFHKISFHKNLAGSLIYGVWLQITNDVTICLLYVYWWTLNLGVLAAMCSMILQHINGNDTGR